MLRMIRIPDSVWRQLKGAAAEDACSLLETATATLLEGLAARAQLLGRGRASVTQASKAILAEAAEAEPERITFCRSCKHSIARHSDGKACDSAGCPCRRFSR